MQMYNLYYGTFVHTPTLNKIEVHTNTLVGVDCTGTIDYIAYSCNLRDPVKFFFVSRTSQDPISDFKFHDVLKNTTQFFFPGFIDTHIHASQYPNLALALGVPLLDWLRELTFPSESKFKANNMDMARDVYTKVIKKTLSHGTTCASYFATIDYATTALFADLLMHYGQRGFVGKVCMDHNEPYPQYVELLNESMELSQKIIDYINQKYPLARLEGMMTPIITPRFAPLCLELLLESLGALAKNNNLPVQTHIAENLKELALVKQIFPRFDNYTAVYDNFLLLGDKTILAHAIHLNDDECEIIRQRQCSISHCPTSNTFICSGQAPIRRYLKQNINISLGTDLSGGFEPLILAIMKHAIMVSHHLSIGGQTENSDVRLAVSEVMYMATMGGAKAVGLSDKVGSFAVGKKFDAQLLDLGCPSSPIDIFEWQVPQPGEPAKMVDLLSKWVFNGDDRNCRKVWVNGRIVVDKDAECELWVVV